jgi:hypothetical protein
MEVEVAFWTSAGQVGVSQASNKKARLIPSNKPVQALKSPMTFNFQFIQMPYE